MREDGRVEGWKGGRVEEWKNGRVEGWKGGRWGGWEDPPRSQTATGERSRTPNPEQDFITEAQSSGAFDRATRLSTSTSTIDQGGKALLGKTLAGKQNFDR